MRYRRVFIVGQQEGNKNTFTSLFHVLNSDFCFLVFATFRQWSGHSACIQSSFSLVEISLLAYWWKDVCYSWFRKRTDGFKIFLWKISIVKIIQTERKLAESNKKDTEKWNDKVRKYWPIFSDSVRPMRVHHRFKYSQILRERERKIFLYFIMSFVILPPRSIFHSRYDSSFHKDIKSLCNVPLVLFLCRRIYDLISVLVSVF